MPSALFETTDAAGRVIARCTHGSCEDAPSAAAGALEPSDRSPVILRALGYERTVSVERARDRLVVRAALPLVDPAMRMLGTAVVTAGIDGSVVDRLKAALGAGREVVVYAAGDPNASTFMAATGARLAGPMLPQDFTTAGLGTRTTVVPLEVESHPYSVALGQLQDVTGRAVGLLGVAVDREPLAAARRRASTALILGALSALLLAMVLSNVLARRMTRPLQNLHAGALAIARGDLDTSFAVDTDDEIGDVAEAFRIMTRSLRENQEGLAARVRELVTVHQVGRAVSSVVDLGQVLRAVITEILNVLGGKTVAIALAVEGRVGEQPSFVVRAVAGDPVGERLAPLAGAVAALGRPRRTPAVEADPQLMDHAAGPGLRGPALRGHRSARTRSSVQTRSTAPSPAMNASAAIRMPNATWSAISSGRLERDLAVQLGRRRARLDGPRVAARGERVQTDAALPEPLPHPVRLQRRELPEGLHAEPGEEPRRARGRSERGDRQRREEARRPARRGRGTPAPRRAVGADAAPPAPR